MDMSPNFTELLRQSGWNPDRRIEIAGWVDKLSSEGFVANPAAMAILESLGGLSVPIPRVGNRAYELEIQFDPLRAASGESDRTADWKDRIGVDLFPIGEELLTDNVVWAGSDGRFYYGREFGLYHLGDSFREAMDLLAFSESESEFIKRLD